MGWGLRVLGLLLGQGLGHAEQRLCLRDGANRLPGGRHQMGMAYLDSTDLLLFAGGFFDQEGYLTDRLDVMHGIGEGSGPKADNLSMARTDVATEVTRSALYLAGGCGSKGNAGKPLPVQACWPTDTVDIYAVVPKKGPVQLKQTAGYKLCEDKYAATAAVFYTGSGDEGQQWAPTPHVMIAGGIVPAEAPGEGPHMYKATDTVDIIREDSIGPDGSVKASFLPVQRLPIPRFGLNSCCFKHKCIMAGGMVNLDGYFSDRVDVWDGRVWAWTAEHALAEARISMASVTVEVKLAEGVSNVAFLAGGMAAGGPSFLIDVYNFDTDRWLPRMSLPSVSGPCSAVLLARDLALFTSHDGAVDVFNGSTLCWTSYRMSGSLVGEGIAGRSEEWYFNDEYSRPEGPEPEGVQGVAFIGGGLLPAGAGLSTSVRELRWIDGNLCGEGGQPLTELKKMCGSIQEGDIPGAFAPTNPAQGPAVPAGPPGAKGGKWNTTHRIVLYAIIGTLAVVISYMLSATLILRRVEGFWRLPVGGGACDISCRAIRKMLRSIKATITGQQHAYKSIDEKATGSDEKAEEIDNIEAVDHGKLFAAHAITAASYR
ncbi:unnamed protein product [Chrysoparadoxa australica]